MRMKLRDIPRAFCSWLGLTESPGRATHARSLLLYTRIHTTSDVRVLVLSTAWIHWQSYSPVMRVYGGVTNFKLPKMIISVGQPQRHIGSRIATWVYVCYLTQKMVLAMATPGASPSFLAPRIRAWARSTTTKITSQ